MKMHPWKQLALQALREQYQIEMRSGYDVKESLLALSAVELWVERNEATSVQAFLTELDSFCEDRRKHWQQPGQYNGALGTLGSCRAVIYTTLAYKQRFSITMQRAAIFSRISRFLGF